MKRGFIPGSAHIQELDTVCEGLNIPRTTENALVRVALNNSSGFGGANVCVVFKAL
jgi:3-oxoacyl-[acyl-carrier-protein] synthase I